MNHPCIPIVQQRSPAAVPMVHACGRVIDVCGPPCQVDPLIEETIYLHNLTGISKQSIEELRRRWCVPPC